MTKTNRTLAYATNNAYDTLLLLDGDIVIGAWTVTPEVAATYLDSGDLAEWDPTYPAETTTEDYGEILSREDAAARATEVSR